MKKNTLLIALFLFASLVSFARIGETYGEAEKRYGKHIGKSVEVSSKYGMWGRAYKKSGLQIYAVFLRGSIGLIAYQKIEKDVLGISKELSENEIQILLKANANGKWTGRHPSPFKKQWVSPDDKIVAEYDLAEHTLLIMTVKCMNLSNKLSEENDKEKLNGL